MSFLAGGGIEIRNKLARRLARLLLGKHATHFFGWWVGSNILRFEEVMATDLTARVGPVESDRLHLEPDFARSWIPCVHSLDFQDIGPGIR